MPVSNTDVAVLAVPLGPVHRDVGVAQQLLGGGLARPRAIPMLAVTVTRVSWSAPSLNGCLSASSRRSATSSGPAASESSSEITTNSSPPRRPSASASRTTPSSRAATACSSSSPAPWPSVSLMSLKLSRSTNSAATGVWLRRERASICSTRSRISVRFGRPVERVVGGQERELLLAPRELFVGALALGLEALAHPQQAELEAQLQDVQGLARAPRARRPAARRSRCSTSAIDVAPPKAAPGHLVQRRRAMGGQLAEDLPGFPAGLDRHLHALPRDPAGHRDRRAPADPFEAVLDHGVDASPDPAVRATVMCSTSSARAFSASPRRWRSSAGCSVRADGGVGTSVLVHFRARALNCHRSPQSAARGGSISSILCTRHLRAAVWSVLRTCRARSEPRARKPVGL